MDDLYSDEKSNQWGLFLNCARRREGEKLTARQKEVLQLLAEGRLTKEVADIIGISTRWVAFHKYTMTEHLGMKTTAELIQYAVKRGLARP
jgi:DNA-binding CsgD family transcriptional regulator